MVQIISAIKMSRIYRSEKPVIDVNQWMNHPNGSIFIKYIPNNITKTELRNMFSFLGLISRIDVVNISDGGSGRRAFIHFSQWIANDTSVAVRTNIAQNYPVHTPLIIDSFEYSVTLNSRPIPPADLNPQQLSDWSQRLNDELNDFKTITNARIDGLSTENAMLRNELENIKATLSFFMQPYGEQQEIEYPYEFTGLTEGDLVAMEEFEEEIDTDELRTVGDETCDENNMDEIDVHLEDGEMSFVDLDLVEAGLRRSRDPLIFERSVSVC